jgi:hypothetical protein
MKSSIHSVCISKLPLVYIIPQHWRAAIGVNGVTGATGANGAHEVADAASSEGATGANGAREATEPNATEETPPPQANCKSGRRHAPGRRWLSSRGQPKALGTAPAVAASPREEAAAPSREEAPVPTEWASPKADSVVIPIEWKAALPAAPKGLPTPPGKSMPEGGMTYEQYLGQGPGYLGEEGTITSVGCLGSLMFCRNDCGCCDPPVEFTGKIAVGAICATASEAPPFFRRPRAAAAHGDESSGRPALNDALS